MQTLLATYPNLSIVEASAEDLILDNNDSIVRGIITQDGRQIQVSQVVITTGTFLRGKCYLGQSIALIYLLVGFM